VTVIGQRVRIFLFRRSLKIYAVILFTQSLNVCMMSFVNLPSAPENIFVPRLESFADIVIDRPNLFRPICNGLDPEVTSLLGTTLEIHE